jgi:hypothetical protein
MPLETSKLFQTPYQHIIALDKVFETFILNLPYSFRFDAESRKRTKLLETIYLCIPPLRYYITTSAYIKRCNLYRSFLLGNSGHQIYAYSRRLCLESVQEIIQGYEILREYYRSSALAARLGICVRYTDLTLAILVLDLCFNRDEMIETNGSQCQGSFASVRRCEGRLSASQPIFEFITRQFARTQG